MLDHWIFKRNAAVHSLKGVEKVPARYTNVVSLNTSRPRAFSPTRREKITKIVANLLSRSGIEAQHYKLILLTLDAKGYEYLVMLDLAREHIAFSSTLRQIEQHIIKESMNQFEIVVRAVYWQFNSHESATVDLPRAFMAG
jgi:hypothetical protein